jgi:hypothetical protein
VLTWPLLSLFNTVTELQKEVKFHVVRDTFSRWARPLGDDESSRSSSPHHRIPWATLSAELGSSREVSTTPFGTLSNGEHSFLPGTTLWIQN